MLCLRDAIFLWTNVVSLPGWGDRDKNNGRHFGYAQILYKLKGMLMPFIGKRYILAQKELPPEMSIS